VWIDTPRGGTRKPVGHRLGEGLGVSRYAVLEVEEVVGVVVDVLAGVRVPRTHRSALTRDDAFTAGSGGCSPAPTNASTIGAATGLAGSMPATPHGEVRTAWHSKEVVRSIYEIADPELALEFVTRLGADLQDDTCPPEIRQLGRTIGRWRHQIAAWHRAHVSNGPTEAANNLI